MDKNSHGKVTIAKIGIAKGGIALFKVGDKIYEDQKSVVAKLINPDGTYEAGHCRDISGKGSSCSDILINRHASEVTLIYADDTEQLLADAVKWLTEKRKKQCN